MLNCDGLSMPQSLQSTWPQNSFSMSMPLAILVLMPRTESAEAEDDRKRVIARRSRSTLEAMLEIDCCYSKRAESYKTYLFSIFLSRASRGF